VGAAKTRLCPPLRPAEAAAFYEALLKDTIELCTNIKSVDLAVAVSPPDATGYFKEITPPGTTLLPIECPDIGKCLEITLESLLGSGYKKALAINSDGPSLPRDYISSAVELLDNHDLVLGPGEDGGYYLVGLKQIRPELFYGIDWSTPRVLRQTLTKANDLSLSYAELPAWYDIDTWTDLKRLKDELLHRLESDLPYTRRFFYQCGDLSYPADAPDGHG
jgi:hypothetical protein